ncbi:zinc metalloproteinase nas-13-like [Acropora muricata]|uniref:zinc metalloproteinase nas-13-like n=1 Tax=Acropora muricata TaxID=159855 RepID=UPI0034E491B4
MHEVLHLLGFYHEHQRYDRDNFISIHEENIQLVFSKQFDIIGSQNLLPPYNDYDEHSIMQYNEFAFSKEYGVKKTMEAKDGKKLGQASHMDAIDIMKINKFYGCPALKFKDTKLTLKTADSFLAGTNGDVYVKLKGSQGESDFEQITEGGMIADENERGAKESHNMAFRDVGKVNGLVVALVKKGTLPSEKKKRSFASKEEKRKRWFSTDGWTVETIQLQSSDGTSATFPGGDLYEGDTKELSPS